MTNQRVPEQEIPIEYRRAVRQALVEWREVFNVGFREWILETVKTLAVINGAGLAGVAAIVANDGAAKAMLAGYPSAALFAFGLAVAVIDMYANAQGHLARQREILRRIQQFDGLVLDPRLALSDVKHGNLVFTIASVAGWLSAGSFLAGAWPFIRAALPVI